MQRELKCDINKTLDKRNIFTNSDLNEISQNLFVWPELHKSCKQVLRTRAGTRTDQFLWLPWWLRQKRIYPQCGRCRFNSWARKIPWRWERKHLSITAWWSPCTEEPSGLYSSWGCKESEMTEWLTLSLSLQFSALVIGRADHYLRSVCCSWPWKRSSWWLSGGRRIP